MYTVECEGHPFYNDVSLENSIELFEPNLELNDNSAGKFECTVPETNVEYENLKEMTTTIVVRKNGNYVWSGRIVTINIDFYGRKKIECERRTSK